MHPDVETNVTTSRPARNDSTWRARLSFYELRDAMHEEGCPICWLIAHLDERFLCDVLDGWNNGDLRLNLHASLGFCRRFLRFAALRPDPIAFSILYAPLAEDVARRLREHEVWRLVPAQPCPLASRDKEYAAAYARVFAAHYGEAEFQALHEDGFGFCLGHLDAVLHRLNDPALRERFLSVEERKFSQLADHLKKFAANPDAWFRVFRKFSRPEPPSHRGSRWWAGLCGRIQRAWKALSKQRELATNRNRIHAPAEWTRNPSR